MAAPGTTGVTGAAATGGVAMPALAGGAMAGAVEGGIVSVREAVPVQPARSTMKKAAPNARERQAYMGKPCVRREFRKNDRSGAGFRLTFVPLRRKEHRGGRSRDSRQLADSRQHLIERGGVSGRHMRDEVVLATHRVAAQHLGHAPERADGAVVQLGVKVD